MVRSQANANREILVKAIVIILQSVLILAPVLITGAKQFGALEQKVEGIREDLKNSLDRMDKTCKERASTTLIESNAYADRQIKIHEDWETTRRKFERSK